MKTLPRLLVVCSLAFFAFLAMSSAAFAAPKLIFCDEFNGPLNSSAWQTTNPWYLRQSPQELEYYDPAATTFSSGEVNLTAEKRSMNGHSSSNGWARSSAQSPPATHRRSGTCSTPTAIGATSWRCTGTCARSLAASGSAAHGRRRCAGIASAASGWRTTWR